MIDDSWYQRPPQLSESISAGGVVVRKEADRIYIAVVKEANRPEYVLPKGHVEPGETIEEAAHREIEEEAGLTDLKLLAKLGILERLSFKKRDWKIIHYFLFTTDRADGKPTDPHINYQLGWFPLDELPTFFWPEQKKLVEDNLELIHQSISDSSS
ncbi:NUDIX hydrolase [Lusitaniella coriacea]|uniref:NUDIX hydrolase n=1 Tax=Lusitaniella coriacea TaxID=1983105 RepID=UPI003CEEE1CB